jgi:non-heme chloroperoxidase
MPQQCNYSAIPFYNFSIDLKTECKKWGRSQVKIQGGKMSFINVGKENSTTIDLYYEDHGAGKPVVLIHGWPLNLSSWEKQVPALLDAGCRVVAYDRRGFGYSSKPSSGYTYEVMAEDLHKVITHLNLRDVTLVGFSMGGGEVARYLGKYGADRVSKAVFMAAVPPFLLKTPENPEGVDSTVFENIKQALMTDRPAFLTKFFQNFFNVDVYKDKKVSSEILWWSWYAGMMASPIACYDCVKTWGTDFRDDLRRADIPVLVMQGDTDRIVPFASSGKRMQDFIKHSTLKVIQGGPHAINWTHAEEVNKELIDFINTGKTMGKERTAKVGAGR